MESQVQQFSCFTMIKPTTLKPKQRLISTSYNFSYAGPPEFSNQIVRTLCDRTCNVFTKVKIAPRQKQYMSTYLASVWMWSCNTSQSIYRSRSRP